MALAKFSSTDNARSCEGGFSLLEVLVASTIMAVALTTLAQLFVMSTKANQGAKTTTYAAVLAQQKMEQLRGLAWGFDTLGLPITDISTNIAKVPEEANTGTGLAPGGSVGANIAGYCDFLDRSG